MGFVFDIEKFAIHDGPGIRTAVFFKGCPLHCLWCHNPESQSPRPEIFFNSEKCIGCGWCFQNCPEQCHVMEDGNHMFKRDKCRRCGVCTEKCYAGALEVAGKEMSAEEVMAEVMKDKVFYETSNGGMTLSGGEPMAQFSFCKELLSLAKKNGLHTAIETCGYAPWDEYEQILPLVDLFLFDVKATSPEKHKEFTGVDNILIRNNLDKLAAAGAKIVLRCPLIPGVNDDDEHLDAIGALAERIRPLEVNVEPYHPLGVNKSKRLGRAPDYDNSEFTPDEKVKYYIERISKHTKVTVKKS